MTLRFELERASGAWLVRFFQGIADFRRSRRQRAIDLCIHTHLTRERVWAEQRAARRSLLARERAYLR